MVLNKAFYYMVIVVSIGMALVSAYGLRVTEACAWMLSATWVWRAKTEGERADAMESRAISALRLFGQLRRKLDGRENNNDNHKQDQ